MHQRWHVQDTGRVNSGKGLSTTLTGFAKKELYTAKEHISGLFWQNTRLFRYGRSICVTCRSICVTCRSIGATYLWTALYVRALQGILQLQHTATPCITHLSTTPRLPPPPPPPAHASHGVGESRGIEAEGDVVGTVACTKNTHQHQVTTCVAVCCSVLEKVEVCCSVLQCAAVCCSVRRQAPSNSPPNFCFCFLHLHLPLPPPPHPPWLDRVYSFLLFP